MGSKSPNMDGEMKYLENKNIDNATRKKLRKNDVYETDMHKI